MLEADPPDIFFTLPAELRNRIYELTLVFNGITHLNATQDEYKLNRQQVGLLRVSRTIRKEALSFFCANNILLYHLDPFCLETVRSLTSWLRAVLAACGPKHSLRLKIRIAGDSIRANLDVMLPYLDLVRCTGMELATKEQIRKYYSAMAMGSPSELLKVPECSIFVMEDPDDVRTQEVLEKAVTLARRSRIDKWDRKRLESEYADFGRQYRVRGRSQSEVKAIEARKQQTKNYSAYGSSSLELGVMSNTLQRRYRNGW